MIKIALVDDHTLLRDSLASVINTFENCKVSLLAGDGKELIEKLVVSNTPDIIFLDINMPNMDGYETALWLRKNNPNIIVLILTMYDTDLVLIKLLQHGVRGFLKKDILPEELNIAIQAVLKTGYYYNHNTTGRLLNFVQGSLAPNVNYPHNAVLLNETELKFLRYASSEMTYKQIATAMQISPRTVDNYRDSLFEKLGVKSRTGMAIYAIKNGVISL